MNKFNLVFIFGIVLFSCSSVLAFDTYINSSNIFVDGDVRVGIMSLGSKLDVNGSAEVGYNLSVEDYGFFGFLGSDVNTEIAVWENGSYISLKDGVGPNVNISGDVLMLSGWKNGMKFNLIKRGEGLQWRVFLC